MTKPESTKRHSIIDAFNYLFAELEPSTDEEIEEIIRSVGIDPQVYAAKIEALARQAIQETGRRQLERDRSKYDSSIPARHEGRPDLLQRVKEKMAQLNERSRPAFTHYRNLDEASDTDLEGLLNDLTFLIGDDDSQGQA